MLYPGQEVEGYEVLMVHLSIDDHTLGTYLARHMETGIFLVGDISADLSDSWAIENGREFASYVHANDLFHKIVDEEAFLYESGEI